MATNFKDTWTWSAHVDCESNNYQKSIVLQKTINSYEDFISCVKGFHPVHSGFGQVVKDINSRLKSYSVFRTGIKPAWEDSNNSAEFRFVLPNRSASAYFSLILLEILKDNLFSNLVNGTRILLDRRGFYRMELWMSIMDSKVKSKIESSIVKFLDDIRTRILSCIEEFSDQEAYRELSRISKIQVKYIPKNKLYYVKS